MNLTSVHINTVARYVMSVTTAFIIFISAAFAGESTTPVFSDEEIKSALLNSESIVSPRYNSTVRGHIVTYLKVNRDKTQRLLDRSMLYFPLMEKYLDEYDLPDELKYLAIIESSLIPNARSRAGAVGLWQFMSFTGREHGLRIYSSVDERMDPVKSTEAAMQYLSRLYKEFDDWALAMAAYNSGPGRVRSAIRRSGSRDFWVLQKYLPRETRGYIPKFVAAAYVFKNFHEHGFIPALPDLDVHFTSSILIHDKLTFDEISSISGVDRHIIKTLNPSYRYNYVPASTKGYLLTLPGRVTHLLEKHLIELGSELVEDNAQDEVVIIQDKELEYVFTTYKPHSNESLSEVASKFNIDAYQLKYWNLLHSNLVTELGELKIPIALHHKELMDRLMFEQRMLTAIDVQLDIPALQYITYTKQYDQIPTLVIEERANFNDRDKWTRLNRGESINGVMRRQRRKMDFSSTNTKIRYVRYGQKISLSD